MPQTLSSKSNIPREFSAEQMVTIYDDGLDNL